MAQRFAFRLQTLLRVRTLREQHAKRAVAAAAAEIAQLDAHNAQTQREIARTQELLRAAQGAGALDPLELTRQRAWIAALRRMTLLRLGERQTLSVRLLKLQDALRIARAETRALEKLRERRFDDWKRTRNLREQADADELAQQMHGGELRAARREERLA